MGLVWIAKYSRKERLRGCLSWGDQTAWETKNDTPSEKLNPLLSKASLYGTCWSRKRKGRRVARTSIAFVIKTET